MEMVSGSETSDFHSELTQPVPRESCVVFSRLASFKSGCVTFHFATYVKEYLYAVKHGNKS